MPGQGEREAQVAKHEWVNDPEQASAIHDVARLMRVAFERRIRSLGLTRTQWWVISALVRMDGTTQTELATVLQMERSPLGKVIDNLERDGWVERRPDPNDRRANRVYRTAKVDPLLPVMAKAAHGVFVEATDGLDHADRDRLLAMLKTMKRNLAASLNDPYANVPLPLPPKLRKANAG
jgi:DNA-binding MarR family transcriptional regulator